jgi:chromosome segregation ATPase
MKVNTLSMPLRGGMFGRGGRRGGQDTAAADQTPLEKAQAQLRTTLENTSATPEQVKKDLTALREAKEKAKQELAAAQKELQKVVTVKQEANLVLMGLLD